MAGSPVGSILAGSPVDSILAGNPLDRIWLEAALVPHSDSAFSCRWRFYWGPPSSIAIRSSAGRIKKRLSIGIRWSAKKSLIKPELPGVLALGAFAVVEPAIRVEADFAAPIPCATVVVLPPAVAAREAALFLYVGFTVLRVGGVRAWWTMVPGARTLAGSRRRIVCLRCGPPSGISAGTHTLILTGSRFSRLAGSRCTL